MSSTTEKSAFLRGLIASVPFLVMGAPFAVLFGLVAAETGLTVVQTVSMSILVIAGSAQFTVVQLMTDAVPIWAAILAGLTVNLRTAMYSASLQPHLGRASFGKRLVIAYLNVDASYALGIIEYEKRPEMTLNEKVAYFLGTMSAMTPIWIIGTYVGAIAGSALPDNLSIDFAMPILFLALVGTMVKTLAHVGAAVTSVVVAMALLWLPAGMNLLVAGLAAMIVGAEIERRRGR
ncbi:AzlC family ABC transporter permease [Rhodobacteraceae bacterium]|nr:AzlC family ABC transporter permease [Paracoccaceae bacterium]